MRIKRLLKNQLGRYAVRVGMQVSQFARVLKRRQTASFPAAVHLEAVMVMALVIGAMPLLAMQAASEASAGAGAISMEGRKPLILAQAVTPVPPPAQRTSAESSYDDSAEIPGSNSRLYLIVLSVVGMVILVAVMIFRRHKGRKLKIE